MNSRVLVGYLRETGAVKKSGAVGASGELVKPYVDIRMGLGRPSTRKGILSAVADALIDYDLEAVGGGGVDGIMLSAMYAERYKVRAVAIRDERKKHGLGKIIEGYYYPGDKIALLEGTSTTGDSVRRYHKTLKRYSRMKIMAVCIVVNGMKDEQLSKLEKDIGTPVISLSKKDEYA